MGLSLGLFSQLKLHHHYDYRDVIVKITVHSRVAPFFLLPALDARTGAQKKLVPRNQLSLTFKGNKPVKAQAPPVLKEESVH